MAAPSFDLVMLPWSPVLCEGKRTRVSVAVAVTDAHKYSGLAPSVPTQAPAILRQVLLPVVLDALGPPRSREEWSARFGRGEFTTAEKDELLGYLDRHRDRFDLFHEARPFAQVGGLRTAKGETKPASLLVPSIASGNNVPLFSSHSEADVLAMPPEDAAVWLLHGHCWDTAAIKTGAVGDSKAHNGKTMGNPTGPLGQLGVTVPIGRTLFETIMLNTPILPDGLPPEDRPQWRGPVATAEWDERPVLGPLDLLTWQSRRISLFPESTVDGLRVTRVIVAAGDRLLSTPAYEPHTVWRVEAKPKPGQPPLRPRRLTPGKAAWRGLDALLALSRAAQDSPVITSRLLDQVAALRGEGWLGDEYPLRVETCGIQYGNQSAVIEDAMADALPVPVAALAEDRHVRDRLLDVADQAERLANAVNNLHADLRRALGGEPVPWDKGQRPGDSLIHALDPYVRRLLTRAQRSAGDLDGLERDLEEWERAAERVTYEIAAPIFASAAPAAFGGRTDNGRTYRLATAELNFRGAVNKIVSRAVEARAERVSA